MYMRFTQKASLMTSMRKAVIMLALMLMMLQMLTTPAMAKKRSGEQTTPPVTQQGSVSTPPANNSSSDNTPAGGDISTNQQTPPSSKDKSKDNVGIITDPIKDQGDTGDTPMMGNTLIHCSPGTGCSNEDLGASNDDDKDGSTTSDEDPILIHCGLGVGCSKEDSNAPKDNDKDSSSNSKGPILIHCGQGTGCSKEDASEQKKAATAPANAQENGEIHGCQYDYVYDPNLGVCGPTNHDFAGVIPALFGDRSWPGSAGGYIGLAGGTVQDSATALGVGLQLGLGHYVQDALVDFGDGGGLIGWAIQGLGYTLGATGDVAGVLVEGAGQVVGAVADGVGEVIDDVGSAIGDALGSLF